MAHTTVLVAERLQKLLDSLTSRAAIKQAIMAVESGDRSFRWANATGTHPDGSSIAADAPFFIASIDKLFNATWQ